MVEYIFFANHINSAFKNFILQWKKSVITSFSIELSCL